MERTGDDRIVGGDTLEPRIGSTIDYCSALLESDPAYPLVETMSKLIPASCWCFARTTSFGNGIVLSSSGAIDSKIVVLARAELQRQRTAARSGPRISPTPAFDARYDGGVTLMLADASTQFGIFTFLRTSEFGPFTSRDIRILTLALGAACDRLSALRLHPLPRPSKPDAASSVHRQNLSNESLTGALFILNQNFEIVLERTANAHPRDTETESGDRQAKRLPPVIEATLRKVFARHHDGSANEVVVGGPLPLLSMRTHLMAGPTGQFIGVQIARSEVPNSLISAAERFHLSPREVQVLALLLDGRRLSEVAAKLYITSSTVQDHITNMLSKTESRNRSQLIANVLGWQTKPRHRNP